MADHIVFVGFMGSGKTTVSRKVARALGLPLVDTDQRIEQMNGCTVKDIFAQQGEEGFRRIETETLAELENFERAVISCGGGVVCNSVNRPILKSLGTVVYLNVSLEEAIGRISNPSTRPLLNGPRPVQDIYNERLPWYAEVADITIESDGMAAADVVQLVLSTLEGKDSE